jgi:hypothetical protein
MNDNKDIQAVLFNKDKWSTNSAKLWLKKHGYKPIKRAHMTENFYRYRLHEPVKGEEYRTIKLGQSGIELIYCIK